MTTAAHRNGFLLLSPLVRVSILYLHDELNGNIYVFVNYFWKFIINFVSMFSCYFVPFIDKFNFFSYIILIEYRKQCETSVLRE